MFPYRVQQFKVQNMLTDIQRQAIVDEALSWVGTPYHGHSCTKGAGADCGQFIIGVYRNCGHFPAGVEVPENYPLQVAQHKKDTRYVNTVLTYMDEISEVQVKPGDVVIYKIGLAFTHAAIIVKWPEYVIHAIETHGVSAGHGSNTKFGKLEKRFFTIKNEYIGK